MPSKRPKITLKGKNTKYSELSVELTKKLSKDEKKQDGIFFTPPKTIYENLDHLKPYLSKIQKVLEPSCGSCEYLLKLKELYPKLNLTGIEYNDEIFKSIEKLSSGNLTLLHEDFLSYNSQEKYDLIIGNPPYYVMKKKDVKSKYYKYFDGRPNIFILFIIKSLELLKEGGLLSFVLPKNFLNCLYYDKTRAYINDKCSIIDIYDCETDYIDTKQETIILIIKKTTVQSHQKANQKYILNKGDYTIFGTPESIKEIQNLYEGAKTMNELGLKISVGNVVWNQCKKILTDDSKETLLIYSSYIKNNQLKIAKHGSQEKKNYIKKKGERGPLLVLNRGYGKGKYSFDYCLIEIDNEYLIENHLICIRNANSKSDSKSTKALYKKIMRSFEDERTEKFIDIYFGNNAINTTELGEILPIYLI